jgi:hypothetical protein
MLEVPGIVSPVPLTAMVLSLPRLLSMEMVSKNVLLLATTLPVVELLPIQATAL